MKIPKLIMIKIYLMKVLSL